MSTKTLATSALLKLRTILANDEGRKARLQAMADAIRQKATMEPRRIGCGESVESLLDLAKEVQS